MHRGLFCFYGKSFYIHYIAQLPPTLGWGEGERERKLTLFMCVLRKCDGRVNRPYLSLRKCVVCVLRKLSICTLHKTVKP